MGYWRVFVGGVELLLLLAVVSALFVGISWVVFALVSRWLPLVGRRGRNSD